jgi:rod shape-determining protein MreC
MAQLRVDVFSRRGLAPRVADALGTPLLLLMFVSVTLLVLSRVHNSYVERARAEVEQAMAPMLDAMLVPLQPLRQFGRSVSRFVDSTREIEALSAETQRLRGWEWRARDLERRLEALERLSRVVPDKGIRFVTARVIVHGSGAFAHIALVNAGSEQGLRNGFPAISADGLVGRVLTTGPGAARLLLVTDIDSRIPVQIGSGQVRGIMLGDNSAQPRLSFVPTEALIANGADVYTSGAAGIFPRGLRIGRTVVSGDSVRVRLDAALDQMDYVSILFYDTPALDLVGGEPTPVPRRRAPKREPAEQ